MRVERAEAAGLGVALAAHIALLWALGLPRDTDIVPPPAMEVSFVDETGLQASAPAVAPSAASVAPELGAPEEAASVPPPPAEAVPEPDPRPIPPPPPRQAVPTPQPRRAAPAPAQSQPRPQPRPTQGAGRAQADRGSRLGRDLLKGLGDDPVARNPEPSAAVVSAQARASMDAAILRALLPCRRQSLPAPEAGSIRVRVAVILNANGSLSSARVLSVSGASGSLAIYEQRMRDLATNVIEQCAPIRGLPAEYYDVPRGWRRFNYTFPDS